jgi:diaminopropionate ammonia-lyase
MGLLRPAVRDGANRGLFTSDDLERVEIFFRARPELRPTPLRPLPALAMRLGVGELLVKDESDRFGTSAFKSVGVRYAVDRLLESSRDRPATVLACATAGNHGRAVARVARDRRLDARVYVPGQTAAAVRRAIAAEGATVVIVDGTYEDAVRRVADEAEREGWTIVSDTSWPGYEEIPRWIMAGYTHILEEAAREWGPAPPDVVLVQGGVGGLVCAAVSWLAHRFGAGRPFVAACEPLHAACLLESARRGSPTRVEGRLDTMMSGLRCAQVSPAAFPAILSLADAYVAIDDGYASEAMRLLARPEPGDVPIVAGASGACGLGALVALLSEAALAEIRDAARLDARSRVFVINTEGANDPELYEVLTREG